HGRPGTATAATRFTAPAAAGSARGSAHERARGARRRTSGRAVDRIETFRFDIAGTIPAAHAGSARATRYAPSGNRHPAGIRRRPDGRTRGRAAVVPEPRSEEHTSEL